MMVLVLLVCGVVSEEGWGLGRGGRLEVEEGGGLAGPFVTSAILNEMTHGQRDRKYIRTHARTHTKPHRC